MFTQDATALRGKVDLVEAKAPESGNGQAFAQRFELASSVTAVVRCRRF